MTENVEQNNEHPDAKWYAIHVLSGHENKVKAYLENEAALAYHSVRRDYRDARW